MTLANGVIDDAQHKEFDERRGNDEAKSPGGLPIQDCGVKKKDANQENGGGNCQEHKKTEYTNALAAQFCRAEGVGFDFICGHQGKQSRELTGP